MTTLKRSRNNTSPQFRGGISSAASIEARYVVIADPAVYSRFKAQLKRAVDSVDVPGYVIDAIKIAIRR